MYNDGFLSRLLTTCLTSKREFAGNENTCGDEEVPFNL